MTFLSGFVKLLIVIAINGASFLEKTVFVDKYAVLEWIFIDKIHVPLIILF